MIETQLQKFRTSDGETLHGLLFRPAGGVTTERALLYVHGVANNFYATPLVGFAQALADQGRPGFVFNTRGHDWVARAGADGSAFMGAAYENFEDAALDLDGAMAFLAEQGYRRFVLVGHSLGAVKSVYYQGLRQRSDVDAVIACSPPRTFYAARQEDGGDFPANMATAQRLAAQGRGEELLWALAGSSVGPFTARTYLSKYGPDTQSDVRPCAARVGVPLLTLAGGAEPEPFARHVRELSEAAGAHGTGRIIDGANHSYTGHEPIVQEAIATWLAERGL